MKTIGDNLSVPIVERNKKKQNKSDPLKIRDKFSNEGKSSTVTLVVKDYKVKDGLSNKICTDEVGFDIQSPSYVIKGPLGKGLYLKPAGVHVAFTAGTGILPFIDLVAHLIRANLDQLNINPKNNMNSLGKKHK